MNALSKFRSSSIEKGKRILKMLGIGGDVFTAKEAMPFGWDSQPTANVSAVYCTTTNLGDRFVLGYVNNLQEAAAGESRHYAVDVSGAVVSYVWTKANGNTEINGNQYSATRQQPLNTSLQNEASLINQNLTAIQAAITSLGGTYIPVNVTVDISPAESPTVKIK